MLNYKKLFSIKPFSISQKFKENWYFKDQKNYLFIITKNAENIKKFQIKFSPM